MSALSGEMTPQVDTSMSTRKVAMPSSGWISGYVCTVMWLLSRWARMISGNGPGDSSIWLSVGVTGSSEIRIVTLAPCGS
ncbi:hypothetical protein D9M69_718450 [compost metagenome]